MVLLLMAACMGDFSRALSLLGDLDGLRLISPLSGMDDSEAELRNALALWNAEDTSTDPFMGDMFLLGEFDSEPSEPRERCCGIEPVDVERAIDGMAQSGVSD